MLNLMKSKKLYLIFFGLIIFLFASLFLRDESKDHYNFEEVSNWFSKKIGNLVFVLAHISERRCYSNHEICSSL